MTRFLLACVLALVFTRCASARDVGQWEGTDPAIRQWYNSLTQPHNAPALCCTEADAYWADEITVEKGKVIARITDDRPDAPLGRPHIDVGTPFEIPPESYKYDEGNPTGHAVLFVRRGFYGGDRIYCFVMGTGT